MTIYLDHHATTPCDPLVTEAMLPWFTQWYGNAHSTEHESGLRAAEAVERARGQVAALIGVEPREIVFTSGATESNNLAIKGAARFAASHGAAARRIVTVATEHKCVLESVRDLADEGFEPVVLPVERDGLVDPSMLEEALRVPTLLVSVMAVNNETGVIQDVRTLAEIARKQGALFHTDAAQAAGRIAIDSAGIDLISLSAHKLYGPKGIGALYVRRRPRVRLTPLLSGGGQERGLRSGTLPVPLVVGFGVACALAAERLERDGARLSALRDGMLERLRRAIPGLVVNGSVGQRVPGNLNLTFPGVPAAALMRACPELCLSTGSACTSAEIAPSHVLSAMGLGVHAASRTLRLGIGRFTSAAECDAAVAALTRAWAGLVVQAPQVSPQTSEEREEQRCPG